jgi:hypothetical protein
VVQLNDFAKKKKNNKLGSRKITGWVDAGNRPC